MTEEEKALQQILTAKKRSESCILNILNERRPDRSFVRKMISDFVLIRYLLDDEDVSGLSFDQIAEFSVAKSADISRSMVKDLDTSVDCMGASSLTAKKAMLLRQIEIKLGIQLPAMRSAMIEDLDELGDMVYDELIKTRN